MRKNEVKIIYNEIHCWQKVTNWYEKFGYNFYYYFLKIREFLTRKPTFIHFVYETNTQCTLRCKECHSYMPYFTKESHYMTNFDDFKNEIDKLLKSVDLILSFRLQGGETLLVKDLAKIINYACSKKQIQHMQIISNGTIVPSQELLSAMNNPKVILCLSDYSLNEDVAPKCKHEEIIKLLKENNVNYRHTKSFGGDYWVAKPTIINNEIIDKEFSIKNLKACYCFGIPKSYILFCGKIFICAPQVYYWKTNPDFKISKESFVDVINTTTKNLSPKIRKFTNKKYFDLCARCNTHQIKDYKMIPGEQLKAEQ